MYGIVYFTILTFCNDQFPSSSLQALHDVTYYQLPLLAKLVKNSVQCWNRNFPRFWRYNGNVSTP